MRSSNNKLSVVDRYIKRAIERQEKNNCLIIDENSSVGATSVNPSTRN